MSMEDSFLDCVYDDISNLEKARNFIRDYKESLNDNEKEQIINNIKDFYPKIIERHLSCYKYYYSNEAYSKYIQIYSSAIMEYNDWFEKLKKTITSMELHNENDKYDNQLLGIIKNYNRLEPIIHDEL